MLNTLLIALCFLTVASDQEKKWWQFLGPDGTGHVRSGDLPLSWSEQQNIRWKTPIHDRGWSSPVISGNQIWITTATEDGHQLFAVCIHKDSGAIIHDVKVFDVEQPQKITHENTYATPTPAVANGRVFVHFGTYGTACLDTNSGRILWSRNDMPCDHENNAGPASSPTIVGDCLIFHVDGRDVQYITALDTETGVTVWKTKRSADFSDVPVHQRKAYSMPGIAPRGDGIQLISPAGRGIYSYDADGQELWKVRHRGWSSFPRPIFGRGLAFTVIDRDHPELWAINVNGTGDVTNSHIVWKETRGMPARSTPLLIEDLLYTVNRDGIITCLEADAGRTVWKDRLPGRYSATPLFVDDRIYLFNEEAVCTVLRPGREYEVLATASLDQQQLLATPAVDDSAFIIRTEGFLYRVESDSGKTDENVKNMPSPK